MVLIASPWNNPLILTRAWCLLEIFTSLQFEVATTFQAPVKLFVKIPSTEVSCFEKGIQADPRCILAVLSNIQAQKASAASAIDLQMIFRMIKDTDGGFARINNEVKKAMRLWYVSTLNNLLKNPLFAEDFHFIHSF